MSSPSSANSPINSHPLDLRLYLVTDEQQCAPRSLVSVVQGALDGGATLVQLRDKTGSTRHMVDVARALLGICHAAGVPLIINDRVDVAMASGADGVHVGQSDMLATDARRLLGPAAIVGVSVRTVQDARDAWRDGASYLGASGIWSTATKTDVGEPLGLQSLKQIIDATPLPVVAIGGIGTAQAPLIAQVGCHGIAVVSAIMKAPDPKLAAQSLRDAFHTANTANTVNTVPRP